MVGQQKSGMKKRMDLVLRIECMVLGWFVMVIKRPLRSEAGETAHQSGFLSTHCY